MQELKEVLFILNKYKVRQIDVITNQHEAPQDSRYRSLYDFLQSKADYSEEEIAEWLDEPAGSKAYNRFLNNFKKRLYNSVLFIDVNQPQFNEMQRAYYTCQQRIAIMETLRGRGTIISPLEIAKQILPVAQKFEFYKIALSALEVFKSYHAFYTGDDKEFEKYSKMAEGYQTIVDAENLAKQCFQRVQLLSINSTGNGKKIHLLCHGFLEKLSRYATKVNSTAYLVNYGLIRVYERMSITKWGDTIAICDEVLQQLDQKPSVSKVLKNAFLHQKAISLFMLQHYEEASNIAGQSIKNVKKGTYNWFKGMEVQLYIKFHQKCYISCWKIYKSTTRHTQFSHMSDAIKEPWRIYYAYLSFISSLGKLELSSREKGDIKKYRLGKFLNEVPIFSKDKRGYNIPILIVQVLYLLLEKKYNRLENRLEALRKYNSRYLKENEEHFRTDCFIRALGLLIKGDFERKKVQPLAEGYIRKMSEKSLSIADQTHEIEVVPYERQWKWILEMLD